jgi:hypothetical protein
MRTLEIPMKMSPLLALILTPLLVACGDGDKAGGGGGGGVMTSANALATHSGPCPILNGRFVRETGEGDTAVVHVRTQAQGGAYSYSFLDPGLSHPEFQIADGYARAVAGDPGRSAYRLSCDARSITSVSTKPGAETITIRYEVLDESHLAVETKGAAYMDGVYEKTR